MTNTEHQLLFSTELAKIMSIVKTPSNSLDETGRSLFNLFQNDPFYVSIRERPSYTSPDERKAFIQNISTLDDSEFSYHGFNSSQFHQYVLSLVIDGISAQSFEIINGSYYIGLNTSNSLSALTTTHHSIISELLKALPSTSLILHHWKLYASYARETLSAIKTENYPHISHFGDSDGLFQKIKNDFLLLHCKITTDLSSSLTQSDLHILNNSTIQLGFFDSIPKSFLSKENVNYIIQEAISSHNDDVVLWALSNNADTIHLAPYYVYPFNTQRCMPPQMSLFEMSTCSSHRELQPTTIAKLHHLHERDKLISSSVGLVSKPAPTMAL